MGKAIITYLFAMSLTSFAHTQIDSCEIYVDYDIDINDRTIKISRDSEEVVRIDKKNQLFLKGKKQTLNEEQQALVNEMAADYKKLLPQVSEIAIEGAELGMKAATIALGALFDSDNDQVEALTTKFEQLSDKLKEHVNDKHLSGKVMTMDFFEAEFEQEVEAIVTEAVENINGKQIWSMIGKFFSSDRQEMEDFEFRMEMLEHDIEAQIEQEAEQLEKSADLLCEHLKRMDKTEKKLSKELSEYKHYDIIRVDY